VAISFQKVTERHSSLFEYTSVHFVEPGNNNNKRHKS